MDFHRVKMINGILLALLVLTLVTPVVAQRLDGTLRGEVTDPQGALVTDAKVTATNDKTGVSNTTTTTSSGDYVFPNLLVGTYTITVEGSGFQKYTRTNVEVRSNQVVEANAKLSVGTLAETVEVTAGAEVVQTTTSQLSNTFDARQITNVPYNTVLGANGILNLAILAPNTTTQGGGVLGQGGSIGGTRPRMNNFTVDGVDDNRVDITGPNSNVVQDAVAEFNLLTNQFSAEYGHSAGGQFNIITKSGGNDWHGTAFAVNSNKNFNAFDNIEKTAQGCATNPDCEKPRFDFTTLGGSVGGPIKKDKAFIFGAYQRVFAGFASSGVTFNAPTAQGLTNLQTLADNPSVLEIIDQFPTAPAGGVSTINVTNTATGQTLPVDIGSTAALAPSFFDEYDFHINGDLVLGKHQLRLRYLNNNQKTPNLSDPPLPQFSGSILFEVDKAAVTDVWAITPRLINDLRLGYTRQINAFTVPDQFNNFPNVFVIELGQNFQVGPEGNSPQGSGQNVYQVLDQMTWSKGAHTVKYGGEYRRWIAPGGFLPRSRGEWQYATLQELVNDLVPSTFAKRGAGTGKTDGNQTAIYWFVQDDWKLSPRLTLNLGIRYEWVGIPNMARTQALNQLSTVPGTVFDFHIPRTDTNNWAPRLGFAWDPLGDGKWAIRGGFGVSYDLIAQNFPSLQLPPQLQSEQDPAITCGLPGAPAWCATGQGFLANGGLLQVNIPPANELEARNATQGVMFDQVMPKIYTWTVSVQHELFQNTSLEVRYLGTKGVNLFAQTQLNARSGFDNGGAALPTFFDAASIPASFAPGTPTQFDFLVASARRPFQDLGPGPCAFDAAASNPSTGLVVFSGSGCDTGFLGSVTGFTSNAESIYHSGSVDLQHRFSRGLSLRANYTWAHAIDTATNELFSSFVNPRRAEDGNHIENERGRSVLDIRHKGTVSWTYELPKAGTDSGILKALLHGWVWNGSFLFQTGQPVTALSFNDANGNGDAAGDRAVFNSTGNPRVATGVTPVCWDGATQTLGCSDPSQIVGYLANNPNAGFVAADLGTRTNVGRNSLTTPARNNWDMSFFKNTYISESKYIQFRAEVFNIFNHRQFSFANPGVFPIVGIDDSAINAANYVFVTDNNPDFLNPQQLNGGSRNIQFGLKFIF